MRIVLKVLCTHACNNWKLKCAGKVLFFNFLKLFLNSWQIHSRSNVSPVRTIDGQTRASNTSQSNIKRPPKRRRIPLHLILDSDTFSSTFLVSKQPFFFLSFSSMGRVAKYKKIKAFDPFSKQNNGKGLDFIWGFGNNGAKVKKRSRTAERLQQQKMARRIKRLKTVSTTASKRTLTTEGIDRSLNAPPSEKEDEFDLNDIQASLVPDKDDSHTLLMTESVLQVPTVTATTTTTATSDKPVQGATKATTTTPKVQQMDADKEIKEAQKILKLDDSTLPKFEGRREHESKNAYNKRVKTETRQIIQRQVRNDLNPEKKKRKKEFLNNKKKKKKKGKMQLGDNKDDNDDDDDDFLPKQDHVPFGHQVERPPTFHSLPRGAIPKKASRGDNSNNMNSKKSRKSLQTQHDIQAEQDNLEKMRQQVQQQYAAIRAKRKQAFHL
jgi:hypothetical protein